MIHQASAEPLPAPFSVSFLCQLQALGHRYGIDWLTPLPGGVTDQDSCQRGRIRRSSSLARQASTNSPVPTWNNVMVV